jgi:dynein intermediate chain 1, axonemal
MSTNSSLNKSMTLDNIGDGTATVGTFSVFPSGVSANTNYYKKQSLKPRARLNSISLSSSTITAQRSKMLNYQKYTNNYSRDYADGENDEFEGEILELKKPPDQIYLTDIELSEEVTRILSCTNPQLPENVVQFSFRDHRFKRITGIDHTVIHFQINSNTIHPLSDEAKLFRAEQKRRLKLRMLKNSRNLGSINQTHSSEVNQKSVPISKVDQFSNTNRSTQTHNELPKDQAVQTEKTIKKVLNGQVNQWIIYSVYKNDIEKTESEAEKKNAAARLERVQTASRRIGGGNALIERLLSAKTGKNAAPLNSKYPAKQQTQRLKQQQEDENKIQQQLETINNSFLYFKNNGTKNFIVSLKVIERMVFQNSFEEILEDYKYFEDKSDTLKSKGTLLPLWKFSTSKLTNLNLAATCISWNDYYTDMFAVGLGSLNFFNDSIGFILVYSLKNPSFFEIKIETLSGCTSVEFNKSKYHLLAAGFYDGSVCVYNLKDRSNIIKLNIDSQIQKHIEPVWQVKWMSYDENDDNFYSVSSDGKVINWTMIKNLVITPEIVVSLSNEKQQRYDHTVNCYFETKIKACGTCFDFNCENDLFIVGTEDGYIYEYSVKYLNDLLTTYEAHHMPIYAVKWSPFNPLIFASCSIDWTIKIWNHIYK